MSRDAKTAARGPLPAETIVSVSQLCAEAAEHVAQARFALYTEDTDAEQALAHLDQAIGCLKRMLAYGRAPLAERLAPNGRPC